MAKGGLRLTAKGEKPPEGAGLRDPIAGCYEKEDYARHVTEDAGLAYLGTRATFNISGKAEDLRVADLALKAFAEIHHEWYEAVAAREKACGGGRRGA